VTYQCGKRGRKTLTVTCLGKKPRGSAILAGHGILCRERPERRRLRLRLREPLISSRSLAVSSSSSSSSESPSKSSSLGGIIRLEKRLGSVGPPRNICTVLSIMQWFMKLATCQCLSKYTFATHNIAHIHKCLWVRVYLVSEVSIISIKCKKSILFCYCGRLAVTNMTEALYALQIISCCDISDSGTCTNVNF